MSTKVRSRSSEKQIGRFRKKAKINSRIEGTSARPRLTVFRSNKSIYLQLIDDSRAVTICAASTAELSDNSSSANMQAARAVGGILGKKAMSKGVTSVVFDRSGYLYHGRIRAVAEGAREAGLVF